MDDTDCPRCGSPMKPGGVCPVCELPHDFGRAPAVEPDALPVGPEAAGTVGGRLWQSGRLAVGVAALCFLLGTVLPLVNLQRTHGLTPRVNTSALQMVLGEGIYGRELKSTVLFAVPGAAFGLVSFLLSRRTRSTMVATRPLLFVVALIPALAIAMPLLKLAKRQRFTYAYGPAVWLIVLGVVAGVVGAVQFGRGVADPQARRARDDDED